MPSYPKRGGWRRIRRRGWGRGVGMPRRVKRGAKHGAGKHALAHLPHSIASLSRAKGARVLENLIKRLESIEKVQPGIASAQRSAAPVL